MRIHDLQVVVNLPVPEANAPMEEWHFYNKWNGKVGIVLAFSSRAGKYAFLIRFEDVMQVFTHDQVKIHADEMREWENEERKRSEYRESISDDRTNQR